MWLYNVLQWGNFAILQHSPMIHQCSLLKFSIVSFVVVIYALMLKFESLKTELFYLK
jgi:hypothetical protein